MIAVVLVADHIPLREALGSCLELEEGLAVIGEGPDVPAIIELVGRSAPDVVILEGHLGGGEGLAGIPAVLSASPSTRVLVLSTRADPAEHLHALRLGARGVILEENLRHGLGAAVHTVARGELWLEPRIGDALLDLLYGAGVSDPERPKPGPNRRWV